MKYLSKPWLVALLAAILLHAAFFLEFEHQDWSIGTPPKTNKARPQLNIELLKPKPSTLQTSQPVASDQPPESTSPPNTTNDISRPKKANIVSEPLQQPTPDVAIEPTSNIEPDTTTPTNTPNDVSSDLPPPPIGLEDIQLQDEAQAPTDLSNSTEKLSTSPTSPEKWKQDGLLDIDNMPPTSTDFDPTDKVFSPTFRAEIDQAIKDQKAYKKGVVKQKAYDITEDADGTKYVNINGVCWKLPEPGSEEEWQVVLSGCAGQKDTFRFELNITTDILTPEQMELLPFGGTE